MAACVPSVLRDGQWRCSTINARAGAYSTWSSPQTSHAPSTSALDVNETERLILGVMDEASQSGNAHKHPQVSFRTLPVHTLAWLRVMQLNYVLNECSQIIRRGRRLLTKVPLRTLFFFFFSFLLVSPPFSLCALEGGTLFSWFTGMTHHIHRINQNLFYVHTLDFAANNQELKYLLDRRYASETRPSAFPLF